MPTPTMKVLADHGLSTNFAFHRIVIPRTGLERHRIFQLPVVSTIPVLLYALRCWWKGFREPERGPFVTVGSAHGFVLALLQWMLKPIRRPRTHVMFDLLLDQRRGGPRGFLDRVKFKIFEKAVDASVVWGEADVDTYSREYGIPREKLIFKPFHITLENYEFEVRDDGYIFAGGNHGRDFQTIIEALGVIDYPVFIATELEGVESLAKRYPNISVRGVSHEEFRQKMAGSTIVVEAHPKNFFRTAGHQTFLNAMWMGKPFVMADRRSALGYFESGRHWLVVDAGDVEGLRQQVQHLLDDPGLAQRISSEAYAVVHRPEYGTLNCMQEIYNLALTIEAEKAGVDATSAMISYY